MIAVTLINLISVFFTYLYSKNIFRKGFGIAILILIVFFGIRYNYGSDYPGYLRIFEDINSTQLTIDFGADNEIEPGWKVLNKLFSPLGFFTLVFFLTCFQFVSIYYFIRRYVSLKYRYIALFIYLFSFGYMLTMISMMRQTLAMNILLWAVPFILEKKYLKSVILVVLAAQFHQSAYLMLIMPLSLFLNELGKKTYALIMFGLFIGAFVFQSQISSMMQIVIDYNFEKYNNYINGEGAKLGGGMGFLFNLAFFSFLVLGDKNDGNKWWLTKCLALSYVFIPFSFVLQLVGRLGMYWQLIGLPGIFNLYDSYGKKIEFKLLMFAFFFIMLHGYFTSFYDDLWRKGFMEYHSIFESTNWR